MDKKTKIILTVAGVGVLVIGLVAFSKGVNKVFSKQDKPNSNPNTDTCPAGQTKCPNSNLCYDPRNVLFGINPCFLIIN